MTRWNDRVLDAFPGLVVASSYNFKRKKATNTTCSNIVEKYLLMNLALGQGFSE